MSSYTQKKIDAIQVAKAAAKADEISPEQEGELNALGEGIRSLGCRSTEEAFELGGYLARAKSILPERALGAWVKAICKFTPKTARNYIAVYQHLSVYKDRLVAAAVAPTMLFVLAYAEQEKVETVLSAIEAGERLTVAQVKSMVDASPRKPAAKTEVLNVGGLAGLRKIAELKVAQDAAQFVGLVTAILAQVDTALEPLAKGRAVRKGALQDAVVYDCRHAHDLINSVAAPLRPDVTAHMNWRPAKLPDGTVWWKVQALLQRMGGVESWPDRADFVPWLENEVVPLLRFVVHGEALGGGEAEVDITSDAEDSSDADLVAFEHMPTPVQETVERALASVSPENRDALKSRIFFDPKPARPRAA